MDYQQLAPKTMKFIYSAYASQSKSSIAPQLRTLVELRTSQLNGCHYCIELYTKDAVTAGATQEKLKNLVNWQTTSLYDEKEKLALAWCESVTLNSENKAEIREKLSVQFSDKEITDLTIIIAIMNALNIIATNLREE